MQSDTVPTAGPTLRSLFRSKHPLVRIASICIPLAAIGAGIAIGLASGAGDRPAAAASTAPAEPAATPLTTLPKPTLPAGLDTSWTGVVGVFAVLVAGLAALTLVARRGLRVKRGNGALHLVDTLALGPRRLLHVVRVNQRLYLVGNSERGVSYLATLPDSALDAAAAETVDPADGRADGDELEAEATFSRVFSGAAAGAARAAGAVR